MDKTQVRKKKRTCVVGSSEKSEDNGPSFLLLREFACLIFSVPGLRAIVKHHSFHLDIQQLICQESNTDVRLLFLLVLLYLIFECSSNNLIQLIQLVNTHQNSE